MVLVKLMVWSGLVVFLDISALGCCAVGFDCWAGFGVLSCFVLVMVSVGRRVGLLEGVVLLIWLPIFPVG